MFPILKGRKFLVTKGYSFPSIIDFVSIRESESNIFHADYGVYLYFNISKFNFDTNTSAHIKFLSPLGIKSTSAMFIVNRNILACLGNFSIKGVWKYQISLNFGTDILYNLDIGRFFVRDNLE